MGNRFSCGTRTENNNTPSLALLEDTYGIKVGGHGRLLVDGRNREQLKLE